MQLSIGAIKYTVRRRYNLRLDGEQCDGVYDAKNLAIWLDADLNPDRWYNILRHEYQHAWQHELGRGKNDEADARMAALIDETFKQELEAAGGIDAIDNIPCEGTRGAPASRASHSAGVFATDNRTCECGTEMAACSIHTSGPLEIAPGSWIVDRWFRCIVCKGVPVWRERSDSFGVPNGGIVGGRMLRDVQADAWESMQKSECSSAMA